MYSDGNGTTNATIANSTIANNSASYNGGGIALYADNITLLQTTISGNTAGNLGDGLYLFSASTAQGVDARRNKPEHVRGEGKEPKPAKVAGSVSAQTVGTVTVTGTIISANPGTDIDTGGDGVTVDSTNSLIGTVGSTITVNNLGGTIFNSIPGLAALANNGGFTQTMALQVFSPAIDTGPTTVPTFTGNENDQRGAGFLRVVNGRVDIGAYEVQAVPLVAAFTG
jgi:parallel beta-helix repeat protein